MSFDIRSAIEDEAKAKRAYDKARQVIPGYFQRNFSDILYYLRQQPELDSYGRLLRLRLIEGDYRIDKGELARISYTELQDRLEIDKILLYSNTVRIEFISKKNKWDVKRYYIHLDYDNLDVFTKDYIEKKFEYERKLELAEKKNADLKSFKDEMLQLKNTIKDANNTIKNATDRYNYLQSLVAEKKQESGV